MSRPSAGRALGAAVLTGLALAAGPGSATAQEPVLGFTEQPQSQRDYESRYLDGVSAD